MTVPLKPCTNHSAVFRSAAEITHGRISDWETSQVTNMESLFFGRTAYGRDANMQSSTDDISRWDTSNFTTMYGMFDVCPIEVNK